MEVTIKQLLSLLSTAMGTNKESATDLPEADWNKLFYLSFIHNIIPMVYQPVQSIRSLSLNKPVLSDTWKQKALEISIHQMYRSIEFLKIYQKLSQVGIHALVVKGIILRNLYPDFYYRSSGDEDVYIQKEDFHKADEILKRSGLIREKCQIKDILHKQEITYTDPEYDLVLELHINLFDPGSRLFGQGNLYFKDAFRDSITIEIDNIPVQTLSYDMHFLFLILHSMKHFLSNGFGIRQVCDLVMFCNHFGRKINWDRIWNIAKERGFLVYLLNLLDIGIRYLGLEKSEISYPASWSEEDIHSEALLEDIMKAGIFGKLSPGRSKSSSIIQQTLLNQRKSAIGNRRMLTGYLFPGFEYMGSHYNYCRKYPFLMPFAWIQRIILYILGSGKPYQMLHTAISGYLTGKERIKLLKEYRMTGI